MASRPDLRVKLRAKQAGNCCYCGHPMTPPIVATKKVKPKSCSETLEHLRRKEDGGTNHYDNMALACFECNTGRGAVDWLTYTSYKRGELWGVS